ncbi:NACHT domain-containing protein [Vacuolonema iberomarrocanum]|uniref:NACHT domain-containing protein n=1 Tax=Vacuolonema iberomarrocanum TaxID=3454632 RepID=UPI0019F2355A|nr:NACHT domain-containing protein [filamentous cyanobacterium LEGE 07170]
MSDGQLPKRLRLTTSGQAIAESALQTTFGGKKADLVRRARVERTTTYRFFRQENLLFDKFEAICIALDLDWEEIGEDPELAPSAPDANASPQTLDLEALVAQVRESVRVHVEHDCGTVQFLGNPRRVDTREIYIDVAMYQSLQSTRDRFVDQRQLMGEHDIDNFDRLGTAQFYHPSSQRITGASAVKLFHRLFIYGKPGSGKTTYLRWIAMQCIEGEVLPDKVPIFLQFRDFVDPSSLPDVPTYITKYLERAQVVGAEAVTRRLLTEGRILLLLDGLDELLEDHRRQIQPLLKQLIAQFQTCHYIISCRPPLQIHLIGFEVLEMADFQRSQIADFAKLWFELIVGFDQSKRFLDRLRGHLAIGELARTPLLLTMLCNVFARDGEFPPNRSSLYQRGFDILLGDWDEYRNVGRDNLYRQLNTRAKRALLSLIASRFFKQGKTLFPRWEVEKVIETFFRNNWDIDLFDIDPDAILEAIELQHGLVVTRAAGYASFSHLTFQEYLTAVFLVDRQEYPYVYDYVTDERWRFVVEVIAERLDESKIDEFLLSTKNSLDMFLQPYPRLQEFVQWIAAFVDTTVAPSEEQKTYHKTLLRARYFVSLLEDVSAPSGFAMLSSRRSLEFPNFEYATVTYSNQVCEFHGLLLRLFHSKPGDHAMFPGIVKKLTKIAQKFDNFPMKNSLDNWNFLAQQQLANYHNEAEWWYARYPFWQDLTRQFLAQHCDIKCDWNFSDEEKSLLRQYFNGTKLLADCLNLSRVMEEGDLYHHIANHLLILENGVHDSEG